MRTSGEKLGGDGTICRKETGHGHLYPPSPRRGAGMADRKSCANILDRVLLGIISEAAELR